MRPMQQPADDYIAVNLCLARQAREVVPASLGCDLFLEGGAWRNLRNPVQDLDAAGCAAPLPAALMVVVFVELLNNLNTACVPNFKGCDWQTTDQVEIERFLRDPLNGKPFCNRMCTASCKVCHSSGPPRSCRRSRRRMPAVATLRRCRAVELRSSRERLQTCHTRWRL